MCIRDRWEIEQSVRVLRTFAPVSSFRAPYLRFPDAYVPLLERAGFALDSSLAKYKRSYRASRRPTTLARIPASMTSSVLRLPAFVRDPWLATLRDPVVLFVHPWEFVDLTRERLRYDCRFRTGDVALRCLREVIGASPRVPAVRGRDMLGVVALTSAVLNTTPMLVGEATAVVLLVARTRLDRAAALSVLAMDQLLV